MLLARQAAGSPNATKAPDWAPLVWADTQSQIDVAASVSVLSRYELDHRPCDGLLLIFVSGLPKLL